MASNEQKQIAERIKIIRINCNMTKTGFAEMLGVSPQYIGRIERGTQSPSADLIAAICRATGLSADYIISGSVYAIRDKETAAALYGLSNDQINIALNIIKKVARFVNTENGNNALLKEISCECGYSPERFIKAARL